MAKEKVIGIDLFAGAGGMSLGAKMAGVSISYALEKDIYAAQTYQANHPSTKVINADIRDVTTLSIPSKLPIILFGGAPCQGFSTSNRRTNSRANPDNWLYKEFIRMLRTLSPDWVVFENVTGLLEMESGAFFKGVLTDFSDSGYECVYKVLKASNFGIPQNRNRLFIIGSKSRTRLIITEKNDSPKYTVRDAFCDLPRLENGASIDILEYPKLPDNEYALSMRGTLTECTGNLVSRNADYVLRRYKYINQGENWSSVPPELMKNYTDTSRCHTGIYRRLSENEASVVIGNYRKNMLIHPTENRGLSVREAARLQSFPDNYVFKGSLGYQQQQVGNAVPPLMAKHIFQSILEQM